MMRILRDEHGQTLVLTALCLGAMLGFVALATDVGVMFHSRRNMQIAADSAAVAGALDYLYNGSTTTAQTAAQSASSSNNFTNGTNGAVVTVNIPPTSGPNVGSAGYAEVIVSQPINTGFMRYFGTNSVAVSARAVAGAPTAGAACIWLQPLSSSTPALDLRGAYDLELPGCGIYVDSSNANSIKITGNGGTVNAKYLDVLGNPSLQHNTSPTSVTKNSGTRTSPWGNLTGPTQATACTVANTDAAASITLATLPSPVNGVVCFSATNVTLPAGLALPGATGGVVYLAENGVTIGGTMSIGTATAGATLDINTGTFNQGNSILNIHAPTSGTYNGIALFQPVTNTNQLQVQFGSSNQVFDGYIYAPGAEVFLQDNGGGITATGIVAAELFDSASTITIPSYDTAHPTSTINRVITLVE
jgi:Flp pilus assembly protein TadG